jgi:hypothetical protein
MANSKKDREKIAKLRELFLSQVMDKLNVNVLQDILARHRHMKRLRGEYTSNLPFSTINEYARKRALLKLLCVISNTKDHVAIKCFAYIPKDTNYPLEWSYESCLYGAEITVKVFPDDWGFTILIKKNTGDLDVIEGVFEDIMERIFDPENRDDGKKDELNLYGTHMYRELAGDYCDSFGIMQDIRRKFSDTINKFYNSDDKEYHEPIVFVQTNSGTKIYNEPILEVVKLSDAVYIDAPVNYKMGYLVWLLCGALTVTD